jgi:hypothetical protein
MTNLITLPLITLGLATGAFVPWIMMHLELERRDKRRHADELALRNALIDEQASTINAYREFVSTDVNFTLTSQ